MKLKEKLDNDMDKAWEGLYQRLEDDGLLESVRDSGQPQLRRTPTLMWAASVAVVLIGLVTFFLIKRENVVETEKLVLHTTQGSPTLVTTLDDGSTVYLRGETSMTYPVQFVGNKREIALDGDAFFEIARDTENPFIIDTKSVLVEVLGTSFSVQTTEVIPFALSVRNGEVRVTFKETGQSTHVRAGQTALLNADKLQTVATTDTGLFKTYLNHIHFKDQTLANVIRIMNGKNAGAAQINCAPEIAGKALTVNFSDESPEEIAEIICTAFKLSYTQELGNIYITSD